MKLLGRVRGLFNLSRQFNQRPFLADFRVIMADGGPDGLVKYSTVTEGKATISQPASVFYNPVQEFNRDLTIAVISHFAEEHIREVNDKRNKAAAKSNGDGNEVSESNINVVTETAELKAGVPHEDGVCILEGLAASGLRSMRFGLEIPGVKKIITNDFDKNAVEVIKINIEKNNLEDLVEASHNDASMLMYQHRSYKDRFDVIDLDPYGSAAPFLDSAVQAVRDGGLLCVTSTDASVLCGNGTEKCFTLYGSMSLRAKFCHEMGIRIILNAIQSHAARYSRYIVPLISLSVDFYFRVFVRVYTGQYKAKFSTTKSGLVYHCVGCGSYSTQPFGVTQSTQGDNVKFKPSTGPPVSEKCEHCGFKNQLGGPVYLGQLHENEFVQKIIESVTLKPERFKTSKRIEGMLSMVTEELDVPLYYESDGLCKVLHCSPPTIMKLRSAILNAGYKVSFSHALKNSLKTDAPNSVIWDIMRAWVAKHPINEKWLQPGTVAAAILAQKPSIEVSFGNHDSANPKSRSQGLVRWQPNPEKNWGPKPRAKHTDDGDTLEERRVRNQGKRKRASEEDKDTVEKPSKQVSQEPVIGEEENQMEVSSTDK